MKSQKKFQIVIFLVKKYFYLYFLNLVRQSILFLRAIQKRSMAWICRIMKLFYTFSKRLKSLFFPFFQKSRMEQLLGPRICKIFLEPNSMESVRVRICLIILVIICVSFIICRYLRDYIEYRDKMLHGGINWKQNMNVQDFVKWKKSRFRYKISFYKEKLMGTELAREVRKTLLYLGSREGEIMRWILVSMLVVLFLFCLEKIVFPLLISLIPNLISLIYNLIYAFAFSFCVSFYVSRHLFYCLLYRLGLLEKFIDLMYRLDFFR